MYVLAWLIFHIDPLKRGIFLKTCGLALSCCKSYGSHSTDCPYHMYLESQKRRYSIKTLPLKFILPRVLSFFYQKELMWSPVEPNFVNTKQHFFLFFDRTNPAYFSSSLQINFLDRHKDWRVRSTLDSLPEIETWWNGFPLFSEFSLT